MINKERVDELIREIGVNNFLEVAMLFIEETDELIRVIEHNHDIKTLEKKLHFLKGSALNFGMRELADLCQLKETLFIRGHKSLQADDIKAMYERSRSAFLNELEGLMIY